MKMNILVTLNSGYIQPLTVMLNSLLSSNSNRDFRVFVAHSSLTREDFRYLEEHVPMDRCELVNIQVPHTMFADAPVLERLPKETYYRLFAAQLLPREVNRVLYLDPDLVVVHSIDQLYRLDFKGNLFAAASHQFGPMQWLNRTRLQMPEGSKYINAGVMLMNLQLLREVQDVQAVFDYIRENREKLYLLDQDILNGMYGGSTLAIDALLYNLDDRYLLNHNLLTRPSRHVDMDWVKENVVIVHYCGKSKHGRRIIRAGWAFSMSVTADAWVRQQCPASPIKRRYRLHKQEEWPKSGVKKAGELFLQLFLVFK